MGNLSQNSQKGKSLEHSAIVQSVPGVENAGSDDALSMLDIALDHPDIRTITYKEAQKLFPKRHSLLNRMAKNPDQTYAILDFGDGKREPKIILSPDDSILVRRDYVLRILITARLGKVICILPRYYCKERKAEGLQHYFLLRPKSMLRYRLYEAIIVEQVLSDYGDMQISRDHLEKNLSKEDKELHERVTNSKDDDPDPDLHTVSRWVSWFRRVRAKLEEILSASRYSEMLFEGFHKDSCAGSLLSCVREHNYFWLKRITMLFLLEDRHFPD